MTTKRGTEQKGVRKGGDVHINTYEWAKCKAVGERKDERAKKTEKGVRRSGGGGGGGSRAWDR